MASPTITAEEQKKLWEGGTSPFKASYGKLMMWFFLINASCRLYPDNNVNDYSCENVEAVKACNNKE